MVNSYVRTVGIVLIFWNVLDLYDQPACQGADLNIPEGRVLVIGIDGVLDPISNIEGIDKDGFLYPK